MSRRFHDSLTVQTIECYLYTPRTGVRPDAAVVSGRRAGQVADSDVSGRCDHGLSVFLTGRDRPASNCIRQVDISRV